MVTGAVTLPTTAAGNLHLTVGNTAAMTVGVPVANNTGTGILTLVKNGSGTLRLDAVNTYTGDTAINAGTLRHPVYGTGTWVSQRVPAGTYDKAFQDGAPEVRRRVEREMGAALNDIARKV